MEIKRSVHGASWLMSRHCYRLLKCEASKMWSALLPSHSFYLLQNQSHIHQGNAGLLRRHASRPAPFCCTMHCWNTCLALNKSVDGSWLQWAARVSSSRPPLSGSVASCHNRNGDSLMTDESIPNGGCTYEAGYSMVHRVHSKTCSAVQSTIAIHDCHLAILLLSHM